MSEQSTINMARGLGFMAGILTKHMREPICGKCRGLSKTADGVRENMALFEKTYDIKNLPADMKRLYSEAKKAMDGLHLPDKPVPQKKLGHCNLPDKGCFVKYSRAFFDRICAT